MRACTRPARRAPAETSILDSAAPVIAETSSTQSGPIGSVAMSCDMPDDQAMFSAETREAEVGTQINSRAEAQGEIDIARMNNLTAQFDSKVSEVKEESRACGISTDSVDEGQYRDPDLSLDVEHSAIDDARIKLDDIRIAVGAVGSHMALAVEAKSSGTTHLASAGVASADAQTNASPPTDIGDNNIVKSDEILSMSPRVCSQAESPRCEASEEGTKNAQYLPSSPMAMTDRTAVRLPTTTGSGHGRASLVGRLGGAQTHQHSLTHSYSCVPSQSHLAAARGSEGGNLPRMR